MRVFRLLSIVILVTAISLAFNQHQVSAGDNLFASATPSTITDPPALPIPPVTEIAPTGDPLDVVNYWNAHADQLTAMFGDPLRAKALFAMYTVHISKPYGVAPMVPDLADFEALDRAHCGDDELAQRQISNALGLTTRALAFTNFWHGWLEVQIAGHWEIFDSTTNIWIDQPMDALLNGAPRSFRNFYTPVFDLNAPDIYRQHLYEGYSVPELWGVEPYFGLGALQKRLFPLISLLPVLPLPPQNIRMIDPT